MEESATVSVCEVLTAVVLSQGKKIKEIKGSTSLFSLKFLNITVSFLMHLLLLKSTISGRTPPHLTLTFNEICIFTKASGDLHIRLNLRDLESRTSKSPASHYVLLLSKYFKTSEWKYESNSKSEHSSDTGESVELTKILDFLHPFPTGKLYEFICVLKSSSDKMENRLGQIN